MKLALKIGILLTGVLLAEGIALAEDPLTEKSLPSAFEIIQQAIQDKKLDRATEQLQPLLAQGKKDLTAARAAYSLGYAYALQEKYDLALSAFQNLIDNFPVNPQEFRDEMVMSHIDMDPSGPKIDQLKSYSISTLVVLGQLQKGEVYATQKRHSEALREFQKVLTNYPQSPLATYALYETGMANIYLNNEDEGISILKKVSSRSPSLDWRIRALFILGDFYSKKNNYHQAINEYSKVLNIAVDDTNKAAAHFNLGECYEKLEDYGKALAEYQKLLDNYSDAEGGWPRLARGKIAVIKQIKLPQREKKGKSSIILGK